jgi:glycosidase
MGVWTLGARGRSWSQKCFRGREDEFRCGDIAGSPYAVCGYDVSRKLGGETALARFRRKLNTRGIKLILDFVPNHTALDHPWVREHPEYYVTTSERRDGVIKPYRSAGRWFACGHCGHGSPWIDTLQLDYRNFELHGAMAGELLAIADKCDGVRCDMAMLVLNEVFVRTWRQFPSAHGTASTEFWAEAIRAVRQQRSGFLFLAEVYWDLETRLQKLGFDFTYNKRLYDCILAHDAPRATHYLESLTAEFLSRSVHFIENHDEPRIASLLPFDEHRAAALLVLALPGMRLLHEGQLSGLRVHANVHFAKRGMESADESIPMFYAQLLAALLRTAVGNGEWRLLKPIVAWAENPTHENFVLVQWQAQPRAFDLAVVNLAAAHSQCYAPLNIEALAGATWRFADLLGDEVHERRGAELVERGLYLDLPPHGAQLFHCERIQ